MDLDTRPTVPVQSPPDSPCRPEPEQPRLGIVHLLGLTACVAVHFSVARAFRSPDWVPRLELSLVLAVVAELGRAAALGGLLLWVARRYRRLPFPGQPGETLLVLLGVGAAMGLVERPLQYGAAQILTLPPLAPWGIWFLAMLLLAGLYLLAAARASTPRWRVYFISVLVVGGITVLLPPLLTLLGSPGNNLLQRLLPILSQSPQLVPAVVLLFVAVKDFRQHLRFRWTHWLGIGIGLSNGLISGIWVTWIALS